MTDDREAAFTTLGHPDEEGTPLRDMVAALEAALTRREQEMQLRLRNMLAMIRAIVRKTGEEVETLEDYRLRLEGRIAAFTRVQSLLLSDHSAGIDLFAMVADEVLLAGLDDDTVHCEGESVRLAGRAANLVVLLVHELVRIAAAHHDRPTRPIVVMRQSTRVLEGEAQLCIDWLENWIDGRAGDERTALRWLEGALAYELGATASATGVEGGSCRQYLLPASAALAT